MSTKRIVVAALAAALVFSSVIGMAASLGGVNAEELGADSAVVASCDTDGVTTSYATTYTAAGTAGYKVGDVVVGGIADACDGATMSVTLTNGSDASLGDATTTVDVSSAGGDTSDTVSLAADNVLAESVTGVHVVIAD